MLTRVSLSVRSRVISVDDREELVLVYRNTKRLSYAALGLTLDVLYPCPERSCCATVLLAA
jgi:hypothetical protein